MSGLQIVIVVACYVVGYVVSVPLLVRFAEMGQEDALVIAVMWPGLVGVGLVIGLWLVAGLVSLTFIGPLLVLFMALESPAKWLTARATDGRR